VLEETMDSHSVKIEHRSPIATVNPANGELLREFNPMSNEQVDHAVNDAHQAFLSWRERPVSERSAALARAADLMLERIDELGGLVTLEMGKLRHEAHGEVKLSAEILRYYAENAAKLLAPQPLNVDAGSAEIRYEPLGVLLGVMPWNFPIYQAARFLAPNIAAGNTIVLKHASQCPQCSIAIEKLLTDAGLPRGVYVNLLVPSRTVERVISNTLVRGVSLTGSDAAGQSVAESAGHEVKKSVLELGGSDPFIVLDDVDFERTLDFAVTARVANCGQSCVAAKRFIVLGALYDRFLQAMRERMVALRPGDPTDEATTLAPLSSEQAAQHLIDQIQQAVASGATLVLGGGRIDRPGAYVQPTILTDITPDNPVFRAELFGPAAMVYRVETEAEAIELANATPFALGGSVWSGDEQRARNLAARLETGMVWINYPTSSEPQLPFGGVKHSGYGRELGPLGIKEFLNAKLVRVVERGAQPTAGFFG
jgi:succinate-semialdehyde dehydrogenase/glutarate-semialdehyde dehydrogenase